MINVNSIYYNKKFPETSSIVLLLFCGYVLTWYLQIGYRIEFLGKIRFEFIYAFCLGCIVVLQKNKFICDKKLVWATFLLYLSMIIQIPFSYDFNLSYNVFLDRVVKFSVMAIFIISFVRQPKHLAFFIGAFLLACMKMGLEGLIGQVTGSMVWESQGIMRLNGSTPLYGHPNSFSGMALGTLPFIYYLYPLVNKYIKTLFLAQLIFAMNIIIHTGSRTGYVGFFIFMLALFVKSKNKLIILICSMLIVGVISLNVDNQYVERFSSIFTMSEKEGRSAETRMQIMEDALSIFADHPFGVGVAAFPVVRSIEFGRSQDTHNLYLEIATNLGIQGFLIFIYFIYTIINILLSVEKKAAYMKNCVLNNENYNYFYKDCIFVEACAKAVLLFIVIRLSLGLFGMDLYEIYWWFAVGLAAALRNIVDTLGEYSNEHLLGVN